VGFQARDAFRIRVFAVPNFHRQSRSTVDGDDRDFSNTLLPLSHGSPRSLITFPERRSIPSSPELLYTEKRVIAGRRAGSRSELNISAPAMLNYDIILIPRIESRTM